jgi:transposase InsO family protein
LPSRAKTLFALLHSPVGSACTGEQVPTVAVEYFTKWIEARAVSIITSKTA